MADEQFFAAAALLEEWETFLQVRQSDCGTRESSHLLDGTFVPHDLVRETYLVDVTRTRTPPYMMKSPRDHDLQKYDRRSTLPHERAHDQPIPEDLACSSARVPTRNPECFGAQDQHMMYGAVF